MLQGITGSGKTEVYLRAAAQAMEAGKQVLLLVPEIALTAQIVKRFQAWFGDEVALPTANCHRMNVPMCGIKCVLTVPSC
ncbi:MAG: DEAD/DEAH box helicase [Phascolarctobacterium faecium]